MELLTQPILESPRLILEPHSEKNLQDIFDYACDEEVTKFLTWFPHKTLDDSRAFLKFVADTNKNEKGKLFWTWGIRLKSKNKIIGSIDFKNAHPFAGQIDYAMGKNYWGQGIMTEAATTVRDWAFKTFPELVRLQAFCDPANVGSRRVMEKIGMQYEGLRRKSLLVKGQPWDAVHYAIIK